MGGAESATPCGLLGGRFFRGCVRLAWSQEPAIAATHHEEACSYKANNRVPNCSSLPGHNVRGFYAEHSFGDRAIACTGLAQIERAQGDLEAGQLAGPHKSRVRMVARSIVPKLVRRPSALGRPRIQRDKRNPGHSVLWRGRQENLMSDAVIFEQHVRSIFAIMRWEAFQPVIHDEGFQADPCRRWSQNNDRRELVGVPKDGCSIGILSWISQKAQPPSSGWAIGPVVRLHFLLDERSLVVRIATQKFPRQVCGIEKQSVPMGSRGTPVVTGQ